jgi:hypothetical protein
MGNPYLGARRSFMSRRSTPIVIGCCVLVVMWLALEAFAVWWAIHDLVTSGGHKVLAICVLAFVFVSLLTGRASAG